MLRAGHWLALALIGCHSALPTHSPVGAGGASSESLEDRCRWALDAFGVTNAQVGTNGRFVLSHDAWDGIRDDDADTPALAGRAWSVTYESIATGGRFELQLDPNRARWDYPRYVLAPAGWRQRGRLLLVTFPEGENGLFVGAVSRDGRTVQGCEANAHGFPTVWEGVSRVEPRWRHRDD